MMDFRTKLENVAAAGATELVEIAGARLARNYGDRFAELAALTGEVGLIDLGRRTQIELTGRERAVFLNRFVTNKIDDLAPGHGREAFLTDATGHIRAWLLVLAGRDALLVDADPGAAESILDHLDGYLIRDDVVMADRTGEWAELMLAGPRTDQLLRQLGAAAPPQHLAHWDASLGERLVSLVRIDLGEGWAAVWIRCDVRHAPALWPMLVAAGACPCGRDAAESFRIEAGWPRYGRDITEKNLPQEIARDYRTISFDKGCYLGQETIARIDSRGHVNRRLVRLRLTGDRLPADGAPLVAPDRQAGAVTSAAHGARPGEVVLLGYVRRGYDAPGTALRCPEGTAIVRPSTAARRAAR